ncbi:hypothetical protein ACFL6Y_00645 [Elusimicrobiota bacterium]
MVVSKYKNFFFPVRKPTTNNQQPTAVTQSNLVRRLLCSCLSIMFLAVRPLSAIDFETPKLTHEEKTNIIHLEKSFFIDEESRTLTGENAVFDLNTRMGRARNNLEYEDSSIRLKGDFLDIDRNTGEFHWFNGVSGDLNGTLWRFKARTLEGSTTSYKAKHVNFTSCDRDPPDYNIKAWKARIYPGSHAVFNHAVFYMEGIPFFYLPYFSKSFGRLRPTIYMDPGSNGREGTFVRSVIAYPIPWHNIYTRVHFDYLEKVGVGLGPELLHRGENGTKNAFYLYSIKERNGLRHWDIRADSYNYLSPKLSMQGTFRYMRDPNFNNLYFRENTSRVTPELNSSMAINYRMLSRFNVRGYYDDSWKFNTRTDKFRSISQTLPGIGLTMYPINIGKSAFYVQSSGDLKLLRTRTRAYQHQAFERWTNSGIMSIGHPWRLSFLKLGGNIGGLFGANYTSREAQNITRSMTTYNYGGNLATVIDMGSYADLRLTYNYTLKSEVNHLRQDTRDAYKGVETNNISALNIGRLPMGTSFLAKTSYSFRYKRNTPLIDWTQNLGPVWFSLGIPLYTYGSLALSTNYRVFDRKYVHNISYAQQYRATTCYLGFIYNNSRPNILLPTLKAEFPLKIFLNSIVELTARGEYKSKKQHSLSLDREYLRLFEREIIIHPKLHDFLLSLIFRSRKDVREFMFTIRLKLGYEEQQHFRQRLEEEEFYPWRKKPGIPTKKSGMQKIGTFNP